MTVNPKTLVNLCSPVVACFCLFADHIAQAQVLYIEGPALSCAAVGCSVDERPLSYTFEEIVGAPDEVLAAARSTNTVRV